MSAKLQPNPSIQKQFFHSIRRSLQRKAQHPRLSRQTECCSSAIKENLPTDQLSQISSPKYKAIKQTPKRTPVPNYKLIPCHTVMSSIFPTTMSLSHGSYRLLHVFKASLIPRLYRGFRFAKQPALWRKIIV